jgi:hypothetical protein
MNPIPLTSHKIQMSSEANTPNHNAPYILLDAHQ